MAEGIAGQVTAVLRAHGITVHLVSPQPSGDVVAFLEGNLRQHEAAQELVLRIPAVTAVRFDDQARSVMRVST